MMARGVLVTYETIHQWCRKFGQTFANWLRRRRPRPGDTWHLDEGIGCGCARHSDTIQTSVVVLM